MDVLLVYLNQPRVRALETHMQRLGLRVHREWSGRAALKLATGADVRLIVSAHVLSDMSGEQFHAEVRARPDLARVRFALLHPAPSTAVPDGRDLILDAHGTTENLWRMLAPLVTAFRPASTTTLRGSFDTIDLLQLVASLHNHRATGQLTVADDDLVADLFLLEGELIHAEHLALYGENAMLRVLQLTRSSIDASFEFRALRSPAIARIPRTLGQPTDLTLLNVAVSFDELAVRGELPVASD